MLLSPGKIFVLVLILGIVWFLFRTIERRNRQAADGRHNQPGKSNPAESTVELQHCSHCKAWVSKTCGDKACPISG